MEKATRNYHRKMTRKHHETEGQRMSRLEKTRAECSARWMKNTRPAYITVTLQNTLDPGNYWCNFVTRVLLFWKFSINKMICMLSINIIICVFCKIKRISEKLPEEKISDLIQRAKNKKDIELLIYSVAFKIQRERELINQAC